LVQFVPQFFTNCALQAQYATYHQAFLLGFFVTIENKRLMHLTPKRKVARWNRAGGTIFLSKSDLASHIRDYVPTGLWGDLGDADFPVDAR